MEPRECGMLPGMRLFSFRRSPNALKVRLALAELREEYELIEVNLFRGEHTQPQYAKLNPFKRVPVLQAGKFTLSESNAILMYLARKHQKLWPARLEGEALAMQWMTFEAAHIVRQCSTVWWSERVAPATGMKAASPKKIASIIEELTPALEVTEAHLAKHQFLMGGHYTLVDSCFTATLSLIQGTQVDSGRFGSISAYLGRMRARPSWATAEGDAILNFDNVKGSQAS